MIAPDFVVLAGPNGAGKSTFARANLTSFIEQEVFLNADDIARETNPSDVEAAAMEVARKMLNRRRALLEQRKSLCVETTLATRTLLRLVSEANNAGYRTELVFLFTPAVQINEMRVKQRVMAGGHNIDTDTIRRRHALGLRYLADYWRACRGGIVFDARTRQPIEIVRKNEAGIRVHDEAAFALLNAVITASEGKPL